MWSRTKDKDHKEAGQLYGLEPVKPESYHAGAQGIGNGPVTGRPVIFENE